MSDSIPADRYYSQDHVWVRALSHGGLQLGITEHAQQTLGDIVYLGLPVVDSRWRTGMAFGVVESVKSASDLVMPITGTITAINTSVTDHPELVNQEPYTAGWLVEITAEDPGTVLKMIRADGYATLLASG